MDGLEFLRTIRPEINSPIILLSRSVDPSPFVYLTALLDWKNHPNH